MNNQKPTAFLSIDIEATGPNPYEHSMLSIGCALFGVHHLQVYPLDKIGYLDGKEFTKPITYIGNDKDIFLVKDSLTGNKLVFDPNTKLFWEKNLQAYNHVLTVGARKENTKPLKDQFITYIEELRKQYNLFFIAAPTAYDLSYIIKHFNYDKQIPKQNWIDLFSFMAPIMFLGGNTPDQLRKIYLEAKREAKGLARSYNVGSEHCALFDALQQGLVFESAYNQYAKFHNLFR